MAVHPLRPAARLLIAAVCVFSRMDACAEDRNPERVVSLPSPVFGLSAGGPDELAVGAAATTPSTIDAGRLKANQAGPAEAVFRAELINGEGEPQDGTAIVRVIAPDVELVKPTARGRLRRGQAQIRYRVDRGAVIGTSERMISVSGLRPGVHLITVRLAGNNGRYFGPTQTLEVRIP